MVCGGYVDDAAKAAPGSGMWITPLRRYPRTPALRPHITRRTLAALTRTCALRLPYPGYFFFEKQNPRPSSSRTRHRDFGQNQGLYSDRLRLLKPKGGGLRPLYKAQGLRTLGARFDVVGRSAARNTKLFRNRSN